MTLGKVARKSSAWDASPSYIVLLRILTGLTAAGVVVPCADRANDWRWWFAEDERTERRAKLLCSTCPITVPCASHALKHHEHGVWGGTTERERRAFREAMVPSD